MYTNRAYETSSELDDVSANSANSGHNRVAPLEKDFNESVPTSHVVVSKHNKKQTKSSTKHILTTSDEHKRNSDHRHSNHHRPHSRKGSRPNESNRQI